MSRTSGVLRTFIAGSALGAAISTSLAAAGESGPASFPRSPATSDSPIMNAAPTRPAAPVVFNCADSGTGSLRAAVGAAVSGDTIDMTQLSCSEITLTTGGITVSVNDLAIIGGGPYALGIENSSDPDSFPDGRAFTHTGAGTLSLTGMTISGGSEAGSGGCIMSLGNVSLQSAQVFGCDAISSGDAAGGGVFTTGDFSMRSSQVYVVSIHTGGDARGGGVYVGGNLYSRDSYISRCYVESDSGRAFGGGAFVRGSADIERSAIFANYSGNVNNANGHGNVGGAVFLGATRLVNSLVARNNANGVIGGLYAYAPSLTIHNSTIAFNTAATSIGANNAELAAGVYLYYTPLDLQSTIIANNTFGGGNLFDLNGAGSTVGGSRNLVMGSAIAPPGSLTTDPALGPASFAGTQIVLPLTAASPAIDHGSNPDALGSDQRGAGFLRVFGAAADIGSYELQSGFVDLIFGDGFDVAGGGLRVAVASMPPTSLRAPARSISERKRMRANVFR